MLHVAFVRSVHAHARILGVDTGAATAWPGRGRHRHGRRCRYRPVPDLRQIGAPELCRDGAAVLAWPERVSPARQCPPSWRETDIARRTPPPSWSWTLNRCGGGRRGRRAGACRARGAADNVLLSRASRGEVEKAGGIRRGDRGARSARIRQSAAPLRAGGSREWNAGEGKLTLWSGTQVPHLGPARSGGDPRLAENRIRVIAPRCRRRLRPSRPSSTRKMLPLSPRHALGGPLKWWSSGGKGWWPRPKRARSPLRGARRLRSAGRLLAMDRDRVQRGVSVYPWTAGPRGAHGGGRLLAART